MDFVGRIDSALTRSLQEGKNVVYRGYDLIMADGMVNLQGLLEFNSNRPERERLHLVGVADDEVFRLFEDEAGIGLGVFDFGGAMVVDRISGGREVFRGRETEGVERSRVEILIWASCDDLSAQVEHSNGFPRLLVDGQ